VGVLRQLFGVVHVFEFALVAVRRFPATAYLHPEPSATIIELTEMLMRQWPDFPPYGGAFRTVIPHLTVADRASTDVCDTVERSMATCLPIRCRAMEAWLMCSDDHGKWSPREVFAFKQNSQSSIRYV
jgi:hypothetical protein